MQLTGQRQCNWAVKCDAFTQTAIPQAVDAEIGHSLQPYDMGFEDVPEDLRKPASERTLQRIQHFAEIAGWKELWATVVQAKFTVEQEAL